ncbi:hypothetical protein K8R78_01110 [bacterium]|nr:hypothetical protein [bacterium]
MPKKNCWEVLNCGREEGGSRTDELGVCPASTDAKYDGVNGGSVAGRFCWVIEGTLCNDRIQGNWATKMRHCIMKCDFFKQVQTEEGSEFKI